MRRASTRGRPCRGDADGGGGKCFCTGALAHANPSDDPSLRALGAAATGSCSLEPVPHGAWYCLVEAGKAVHDGIIAHARRWLPCRRGSNGAFISA
jgi:hypothetical protein